MNLATICPACCSHVCVELYDGGEAVSLVRLERAPSICLPPGAAVPYTSLSPGAPAEEFRGCRMETNSSIGDCGTLPVQWAGFPKNLLVVIFDFYINGA